MADLTADQEAKVVKLIEDGKVAWMAKVKEDMIDPLQATLNEYANNLANLELWRVGIDAAATAASTKEKTPKEKEGMTTRRGFSNIPAYHGKPEDYDDWEFKMRRFLEEDTGFKELFMRLDGMTAVPDKDEVAKIFKDMVDAKVTEFDAGWHNHQLYQVLCMNLEGKALSYVKNLKDPKLKNINGVIGWCKLALERTAMTSERLQGLADKVYAPKRCKKYVDVSSAIEEWELNVSLFEKTEDITLSAQTRIYSIRKLVPDELEKDIVRSSLGKDFDAVRKYINEQVTVRRDAKSSSSGPVTMDMNYMKQTLASLVDDDGYGDGHEVHDEEHQGQEDKGEEEKTVMEQLLSFVKGYKGGGKGAFGGKGKGFGKDGGKTGARFDGNCHHCGVYGHAIRDCWKKNEEMKGKGKGKDGGFGSYGPSKGKGKGADFGGKGGYGKGSGKGSAYGFGYYDEALKQSAWTLSLSKVKSGPPPGLAKTSEPNENYWQLLNEANGPKEEEESKQREADLQELAKSYESSYPRQIIGNYSKNKVREMQGGEKKVRFLPMTKSNAKPFQLNMMVRETKKMTFDKSNGKKANEGCNCNEKDSVLSGGHYCPGQSATWTGLAAGDFKPPGSCSDDKMKSPHVITNPLRNGGMNFNHVEKTLSLFFKEPEMKELHPAITKAEDGGWQRIRGVMDSGASESVAHPSMCPQYAVKPSAGSTS